MRATIICVDDERIILDSLRAELKGEFQNEYDIQITESAEEAIEVYEELVDQSIEIPLIISDQLMPGMKGDEFLEYVFKDDNDIRTIMLTGQAEIIDVARAVNNANLFRYIGKPWDKTDLLLTVSTAIQSYYDAKEIEKKNNELFEYKEYLENLVDKRTEELAEKNGEITSSIKYAQKIQNAILPQTEYINKILGEYFIFHKPKDIIGGDFYWLSRRDNDIIIAAADCTGHGVPGALLSILGISLLDRAVNQLNIRQSDKILNYIREEIIRTLNQISGEISDGMDLSVVILNLDNLSAQYSGAYNSLLIAKDNLVVEYKADRIPIGYHPKMDETFNRQEIHLEKGDILYLFSDGFIDQFGGSDNKKFMMREFKELLVGICKEPLKTQNRLIQSAFEEWKGKFVQTDDVLVVGIKI